MTKSQNTKNEQQKDLCITSEQLTEQLKKGELPEGWYYVIKTGDVEMLEYSCNCFLAGDVPLIDNEVTEVLAPVPSYDELQNMNEAVNECMAANIKLVEQNAQLKELLKKANKFLKDYGFTFDGKDCAEAFKVHTKINEILQ